jgi:hypothetical protein
MLMSTKSFRDIMLSLGSRGRVLVETISFYRFSNSPHCQDHPSVVGGILDSGIFEFAGLLYLACFAGERLGDVSRQFDHSMSAHCRGMGLVSTQNTTARRVAHSTVAGKQSLKKTKLKLNRCPAKPNTC